MSKSPLFRIVTQLLNTLSPAVIKLMYSQRKKSVFGWLTSHMCIGSFTF